MQQGQTITFEARREGPTPEVRCYRLPKSDENAAAFRGGEFEVRNYRMDKDEIFFDQSNIG